MEVDHFDPTLRDARRNLYKNLMLACPQCNGKKSDNWPTKAEQKLGIRFLNPCKEIDYGVHIFEDPQTHKLVGKTPTGRYHIDTMDLNHPDFIAERRTRSLVLAERGSSVIFKNKTWKEIHSSLGEIDKLISCLIPPIDPPPK